MKFGFHKQERENGSAYGYFNKKKIHYVYGSVFLFPFFILFPGTSFLQNSAITITGK